MSTTVFITGGSGYVGRNLIRHFTSQGHQIKALARTHTAAGQLETLGAQPVLGDLLTFDCAALEGCAVLIHAAADTDHRNTSFRQYAVNVEGTRRIMEGAKQAGLSRALLISTDSVLQQGDALVGVKETHPYPKKHPGQYSATKAQAEQLALTLNDDAFSVIVLRPRMVWGRDDTTGLPQLTEMVRSGKFAWIDGGEYQNSATHIGNLCHAVESALLRGRGGEIYHVTDGDTISFKELVTALLQTQGLTPPDRSMPRSVLRFLAKAGDAAHRITKGTVQGPLTYQEFATSAQEITLNIDKARTELQYEPPISRLQGLQELREKAWPS